VVIPHHLSRIQCLLSLRNVFFKRRSVFPWVSTVLLCSPTCSFIRMTHINFIQGLLNEKIKVGRSSNCLFQYIDGVVSLKIWWLCCCKTLEVMTSTSPLGTPGPVANENMNVSLLSWCFVLNRPLSVSRWRSRYETDLALTCGNSASFISNSMG
jgi:hypothetical protein